MKRTQQIETSRQMITTALLQLLTKQTLTSITITELVNQANLTRMTFYRHFTSIDDVINSYISDIINQMKLALDQLPNPTVSDFLITKFSILAKHQAQLHFNNHDDLDYLIEKFRHKQYETFATILNIEKTQFELTYHIGGIDAITKQWIKDDMRQTPQEMTQAILKIIRVSTNIK